MNGLLIISAGLALGIGAEGPNPDGYQKQEQAEQRPAPKTDALPQGRLFQDITTFHVPPNDLHPENKPCKGNEEDRSSDLCAQWKAADAAAESARWAWGTALATIVSAGAVLFALGLAYKANRIASDTAKNQLRAYVVFDSVSWEHPKIIGHPYELQIVWKNTGQTPASNLVCNATIQMLDDDTGVMSHAEGRPIGPAIVGPGQVTLGSTLPLSIADLDRIRVGMWRGLIFGTATYHDIFAETEHSVSFCVEIGIKTYPPDLTFTPVGDRNRTGDQPA